MFKRSVAALTVLSILITLLVSFPVLAANPNDELDLLRKQIKNVYDIDHKMYLKLEDVVTRKFVDVNKDGWYMSVMTKLVGLSSIDGTSDSTMEPSKTITRAMFIKMFVRAMEGADALDGVTGRFNHWAARDIKKAEDIGILATNEYRADNIDKPITRGEMAKIIVRAYNKYEINPVSINKCKPLSKVITDYGKILDDHKPYVLIAYGSGIITGFPDGSFGADKTATRAEAAAIVIRYLDTRERAKVTIPSENTREPMVLRYDDPNRPMAIEGDTFIKPDGTSVVLKIGPSGVLGERQGVATEIGRIDLGGTPIKEGDLGTEGEFLGQPYLVDKKTGEGHYIKEWHDIKNHLVKEALEKLGHPEEGTTYGPWLMYKYGQWGWTGPV